MVSTRRARAYQLRVLAQHGPKRCDVTRDDRLHSGLEAADQAVAVDSTTELRQICPTLEAIFVGDNHLCVSDIERCGSHVGHRLATEARVQPLEAPLRGFVARL